MAHCMFIYGHASNIELFSHYSLILDSTKRPLNPDQQKRVSSWMTTPDLQTGVRVAHYLRLCETAETIDWSSRWVSCTSSGPLLDSSFKFLACHATRQLRRAGQRGRKRGA